MICLPYLGYFVIIQAFVILRSTCSILASTVFQNRTWLTLIFGVYMISRLYTCEGRWFLNSRAGLWLFFHWLYVIFLLLVCVWLISFLVCLPHLSLYIPSPTLRMNFSHCFIAYTCFLLYPGSLRIFVYSVLLLDDWKTRPVEYYSVTSSGISTAQSPRGSDELWNARELGVSAACTLSLAIVEHLLDFWNFLFTYYFMHRYYPRPLSFDSLQADIKTYSSSISLMSICAMPYVLLLSFAYWILRR